ncbi:hypothetical protein ASG31_09740 [Chryseobacterium sp. Leaf404]|uniref:hypothetical protein n=1 Tax=unclassified Chryseobacterium TaxID=2593645 RepID=UPI0006F6B7A3|nr:MULTISPECIES: hypothetical protein [unclassified Chryseobacterium]KQT17663.1 hypothetical protein ASG31_09740 [Chryseobacterium sp. Leaf404]
MKKEEILHILKDKISEKIVTLENLIAETRASSNDTKSSMGDKYETGREMLQQEINNLQVQLNEVLKQQDLLSTISCKESSKSEKGALVQTDKGFFYISVSLGNVNYEQVKIFCISPDSPLAKALQDKTEGEQISLKNVAQSILKIW